jgi:L-asparaginase
MERKKHFIILTILIIIFGQISLFSSTKKNIVILATGGTIAGAGKSSTKMEYTSGKVPIEQLIANVPEIQKLAIISGEQICQLPSQAMNNKTWIKLAKRVNTILKSSEVDGVVITHGTDTMEETAYFLNLVINSKKPIVFVGSMRPATAISADGPKNLLNAVSLACSEDSYGKGVLVCLNDEIHSAREATKTHTTNVAAFRNRDFGILGYVLGNKVYFYQKSTRKHTASSKFNIENITSLPKVDIVYGYANNDRYMIDATIKNKVKGIIHAGTGNGNLYPDTMKGLLSARKKDILVVRSSRGNGGVVTRGAEIDDSKYQFITADSLNPQKARVLLMLALTKTNNVKEIQRVFDEY